MMYQINEASKKLFTAIRANKDGSRRERQQKVSKTKTVIDLDLSKSPSARWIEALHLQDSERKLITSGSWINAP